MKKRILTLIIGVVLMLALTACSQKSSEAPAATEAPTEAPTATTAPAVNEDITETVEPTVAPTEAPVIEEPTDVEEVVPTEAPVIEDVEEVVPTEVPVIEEPIVEPTDVPEIEEPVPTEAPVVVEPTDETTPDTNQNTDSETNEDAYHNNSFVPQTAKGQSSEATILTKEEMDALAKAEEERRAKIKSFPLEVTYMHDSKANRAMGKAPELRTRTFNTFNSDDGTDTDLYSVIGHPQNATAFSYEDIKTLVDALDPACVEAVYNQDLTLCWVEAAELLAHDSLTRTMVDGKEIATQPTGEFYVCSVVELSTDTSFIWGMQIVVEDVANPGITYVRSFVGEEIDVLLGF